MTAFAFEMGFDWNMPPSGRGIEVVYALQMFLVNDDASEVVSPCHACKLNVGDTLSFRIYDFTGEPAAPDLAKPAAMQVLFSGATDDPDRFSPINVPPEEDKVQLPQVATTDFQWIPLVNNRTPSIAFGQVSRGWKVTLADSPLTFGNVGRYELRAVVTVAEPGIMARYYRVDPEMVIGDGGPGPGGAQGSSNSR